MEYERSLYVQASTLRGRDRTSNAFYLLIGDGLFSNMDYKVGDLIHNSQTAKLDCYAACQRGEC